MTKDVTQIISGFFKFVVGQGIHLTTILDHFHNIGLIPDWIDFLQETIESNWNLESTLEKISQSCFEVYGPKHRDIVINSLKIWITDNW